MRSRLPVIAVSLLCVVSARAQPVLFAVRTNGDLLWLNSLSGNTQAIGPSGVTSASVAAATYYGGRDANIDVLYTADPARPDDLAQIDRWTGTLRVTNTVTGRPAGYTVRALAVVPQPFYGYPTLYTLLHNPDPSAPDLLATITSTFTVVGPTNRRDLISLAVNRSGQIYAVGADNGGNLFHLDSGTGAATLIGGGMLAATRGLSFVPDGRLLAAGASLLQIDTATGQATTLGPTGFDDICGIGAFFSCYIDCNSGGPPPMLNVLDFSCFINRFAAGSPYANCDESSVRPVLNVNDFGCFLNRWASLQGCP